MSFWQTFSITESTRYLSQNMLVLCGIAGFLGWKLAGKAGIAAGLLFAWYAMSAARVMWFGISPYGFLTLTACGTMTADRFLEASACAAKALLMTGGIVAAVASMSPKAYDRLLKAYTWLAVGSATLMLGNGTAIYYNSSMDASFLVCALPLFFRKEWKWKWLSLIPMIAIVKSGSSTAALAVVFLLLVRFRSVKSLIAILATSLLALQMLPLKHSLTNSNGRIQLWTEAWNYFKAHDVAWAGFGAGTYALHERSFHPEQLWMWPHNDWGLIGFTTGSIGLGLALLVFFVALYRTRETWAFPALATFGFCMVTQPLMGPPWGGIYAALLIKESRRNHGIG